MIKRPMDAFCSAPFCVEVLLRRKLSPPFSQICQHKEWMRGSRSCGPLLGRCCRPIAAFWRCDRTAMWFGQDTVSEVWGEEVSGGGEGASSPYFTPVTLTQRGGKHRSRLHVCGWTCTHGWFRESSDIGGSTQVVQAEGYGSLRCFTVIARDGKRSCSRH